MGEESQFSAKARGAERFKQFQKTAQNIGGHFNGVVLCWVEEREDRFSKAREIPLRDAGLIGEGIAFSAVNGAEADVGVEVIEESAWPVVDGFSGEGHVVSVHDPVNESKLHPKRDESGLFLGCELKELKSRRIRLEVPGGVAVQCVVDEDACRIEVLLDGEPLEGADADVTGGDPSENGAGKSFLAEDGFAGGHDGETASGWDTEGVHGFADEVFAKHGAEGGASVSPTREGGASGAFELEIESRAIRGDLFAEKDGASVAEDGEMAELMPGVGLGDGLSARWEGVSREENGLCWGSEGVWVEAQLGRERTVECDPCWVGDWRWLAGFEKGARKASVGVIQAPAAGIFGMLGLGGSGCRHDLFLKGPRRGERGMVGGLWLYGYQAKSCGTMRPATSVRR